MAAQRAGEYRVSTFGRSLDEVGYIHCSFAGQVTAVAERIFRGEAGLVLLVIDPGRLVAPLRHENLEGAQELFPHIYGPLNTDAVVGVEDFRRGPDGRFAMPRLAPGTKTGSP